MWTIERIDAITLRSIFGFRFASVGLDVGCDSFCFHDQRPQIKAAQPRSAIHAPPQKEKQQQP
jgi:hypothetical protein